MCVFADVCLCVVGLFCLWLHRVERVEKVENKYESNSVTGEGCLTGLRIFLSTLGLKVSFVCVCVFVCACVCACTIEWDLGVERGIASKQNLFRKFK